MPDESDNPKDETVAPAGENDASAGAVAEVVETPEQQIERLRTELNLRTAELEQARDLYLRERAELENFKKRMQRERSEALRYASEGLVRDLLPALDNLERAIDHAESGGNGQPLVEGVKMVLRSALDALDRHGIKRVDAVGQPFDPTQHEAVDRVEQTEVEANHVVAQYQAGYRMHDRLLRPAQVSVSAKTPVEKESADD